MKFALILLSLLAFAFSEEYIVRYSAYNENYGCSLSQVSKCCWQNFDNCCWPAEGPRTCEEKWTLCCKKTVYDMSSGSNKILFFNN